MSDGPEISNETLRGVVVAVSVGAPVWQEMFGRQIFSSIARDPVPGPVMFGKGGPDGNATAVHSEDVFAFFAEHYDHWAATLGMPREVWRDCFWGENLMLSGLTEDRLHIGDRLRVGGAVLEVTSPRVPCFKVAWRLGQPTDFVAQLNADGRMGCYLRVIEPGSIQAGDGAERIATQSDAITVLALSRLLSDGNSRDPEHLRAALATPGIGGQAAEMLRKRIALLVDGTVGQAHRWPGWRPFRIASIVNEASDIRSFLLEPVDGQPIADYRAGQFLTVRLPAAAEGRTRSWSLSDHGREDGHYRITVKRVPLGAASGWLHDTARPGTIVEARSPAGQFVLDRSGLLRTVLISAGIGITPLLAMLKAHAARIDRAPPLLWLHMASSDGHHVFREETEAVLRTLPDSTGRVFYSGDGDRIGADEIERLLDESYTMSPFGRVIELTGDNSDFYICGPAGFEQMVREVLGRRNVPAAHIHSEAFTLPEAPSSTQPLPAEALVTLVRRGRSLPWQRETGETLLELLERHGERVDSSCRDGICGTCEVALVSGATDSPYAAPGGGVLLCCSRPVSPLVELDI